MKRIVIIVSLGLLGLIVMGYACSTRNKFVDLNEAVKAQWQQVENQYQRRSDLIPNIVKTVEAEANFEKSTLVGVVEARSKATQVKVDANNLTEESMQKFKEAQGGLSSALSRLLVVSENYPNLKANQSFSELRVTLEGTENRITTERMNYNNTVKIFNASIKKIPASIFAWGYKDAPYFEAETGAEKAPEVNFNIK